MKFYALLACNEFICTGDDYEESIMPTVQAIKDHGWDKHWRSLPKDRYTLVEIDLEKDTVEILDWNHYK